MVFAEIHAMVEERKRAERPKKKFPSRRGRVIDVIKQAEIDNRPPTQDFFGGIKYEGFSQPMTHPDHPKYNANIFFGYQRGTYALSAKGVLVREEIYEEGKLRIDRLYMLHTDRTIQVYDAIHSTNRWLTNSKSDHKLALHYSHVLRDAKREMQKIPV